LIVVDSSILLASALVDEPLHPQAQQAVLSWTDAKTPLAAPRLFRSEIAAVLRRAAFQKRITHEKGRELLTLLLQTPIEFYEDDRLLLDAYEIAGRFNLPRSYDAQYLALAERLACDFWTVDRTLVNSLQTGFSGVHWLGNFSP